MIIRASHSQNFVVVSKEPLKDSRLSLRAKGLLVFLLAKPDNWEVRPGPLAAELRESRATLYRIIKELLEAGYCERLPRRKRHGQFGESLYVVFENVEARAQFVAQGKSRVEAKTLRFPGSAGGA